MFPRHVEEWPSLDEYYWRHKHWVIAISLITSLLTVAFFSVYGRHDPSSIVSWTPIDWLWEALFVGPLIVLLISRSRRIDLAALMVFTLQYLVAASGLVPV